MLRLKGQVSKIDPSIYHWFDKEGLFEILSLHVDDFLWAGSSKLQKDIISRIGIQIYWIKSESRRDADHVKTEGLY